MISGTSQTIGVDSHPAGVTVTVQPGNVKATTPTRLTLKRNESGYRLRFEKDGYEPVDVRLASTTNGWVYGNLLIGGLIGLLIDYSNGAAYALTPDEITANLSPAEAKAPRGYREQLVIVDRSSGLLATIWLE
jgi:hypothetical protein